MTEADGIVGEFLALAEEADADVLTMQVGDFYEFFDDHAERVAEELDLTVSQKSSHGSSFPMAGVPVAELTPYLRALVERGYRVAVAEQYETEDGHAREIDRIVTPGTLLATPDERSRYLGAIVDGEECGIALADVTTGRFHVTSAEDPATAIGELSRFDPVEVLPGPDLRGEDGALERIRAETDGRATLFDTEAFAPGRAKARLREQFGDGALDSVGLTSAATIQAAGAVLAYVEASGQGVLASITRIEPYGASEHVDLDATTQRNLELTDTMDGESTGTVLATLDHTVTAAGRRCLREWLCRPRQDRAELERRQDGVSALANAAMAREAISDELDGTYDLARLASLAVSGTADPRDLDAVRETLRVLDPLAEICERHAIDDSPIARLLDAGDSETVATLRAELDRALVSDPPGTITEGGIIARGYDESLDAIVADHEAALEWIETLPEREQERTGITHLSVDRNTTDGYYIQVGNSEASDVPDDYRQIKSLKNSERFTTDALDEREREILRLEEQRHERERELFEAVREQVAAASEVLQSVGRALAEIDCLASLATHAVRNDWVRPELVDGSERGDGSESGGRSEGSDGDGESGDDLSIDAGRHPVVEQTTEFVPNDCRLGADRRMLIVTGPNMSGKSTYMRQTALIVLLAQIGSFVPADAARVPLVDGIYTRVGALDELAEGRSTFMVEMQELARILHAASADSLVILDEVGRGTATYDGISIAWAATEYLHNETRAKTLFATHYHELTGLGDRLPGVANVHVAAEERDGSVTFLRQVREGATSRSYGVHVADLAGVPDPVVDRSRDVLEKLRAEKAVEVRGGGSSDTTQAVFDLSSGTFGGSASADGGREPDRIADRFGADAERVLEALESVDVDSTPPVELLAQVQAWQERIDGE
ncbi:DNA mismatch repair protein MutS [Halococcoides cellulosivorans]|uniref:DNA mismatch repair protein MutS n=1 Tax=Halococcoides cellulosivorans TaxID=1679096 RepID=A0A2R4X406_9EURY|nr:DNA mismatch repair protein MutS [Halococcoides cellulosivorans]AWB28535.1 DNA mismatch repair protein MutS [Halococcoides cellulosivorans]